jgi:hypothetical protein
MPHVSCESYRGLAGALRLGILWDEYRDLRDGFRVTNARCEEESADRDPSGALSVIERNLKAFGFRGLSARRALCNNVRTNVLTSFIATDRTVDLALT